MPRAETGGRQMRRREIIALLGGAAAGWPLSALAQAGGVRRVGVLLAFDESDPRPQTWLATLTQGLAEQGWTAGRNVQIEIRWAFRILKPPSPTSEANQVVASSRWPIFTC